jgi:hypothetical protein
MPFHVRINPKSNPSVDEVKLDLTAEQLEQRFLDPYREGRPIVIGGKTIPSDDINRIQISFTLQPSDTILPIVRREREQSNVITFISDQWYVAERGQDVTDDYILIRRRNV